MRLLWRPEMKQNVPLTRSVASAQYKKWQAVGVTLGENVWEVEVDPPVHLGTQLPDIRVYEASDMVFAQVVINLFLFNKMDARRVLLEGERELVYMVNQGETVVIPPLPDFGKVKWVYTLGGTHNKDPLLRFTFDNVDVDLTETGRKRRRGLTDLYGLF